MCVLYYITGARAGGGRRAGPRGCRGGRCAVLHYDALCGCWSRTEVCIWHSNACIIFYYMYRISYELMRHCTHHMYALIYITLYTHIQYREIEAHLDRRTYKVTRRPGNAKEWRTNNAESVSGKGDL